MAKVRSKKYEGKGLTKVDERRAGPLRRSSERRTIVRPQCSPLPAATDSRSTRLSSAGLQPARLSSPLDNGNIVSPNYGDPWQVRRSTSTAVPDEVLQRRELEAHGGGCNRRPAKGPREKRDDADLQEKSPHADEVEDTPPPEIESHIEQCVDAPESGSSGLRGLPYLVWPQFCHGLAGRKGSSLGGRLPRRTAPTTGTYSSS
jgi:hypothetical protein